MYRSVLSAGGGWVASELTIQDGGKHIGRLVLLDAIGPTIPGHQVQVPTGPGPVCQFTV